MHLLQNCNTCASSSQLFCTTALNRLSTQLQICPLGSFLQPNSSDDAFDPAGGSCDYDLCCDLRLGTMGICQDDQIVNI